MIYTLASIALALYWLMRETDWLRIRLAVGESWQAHDRRLLKQLEDQAIENEGYIRIEANGESWVLSPYEQWIYFEYYEPKLIPASYAQIAKRELPLQDKWLATKEDLSARRNGEMIYQRGR